MSKYTLFAAGCIVGWLAGALSGGSPETVEGFFEKHKTSHTMDYGLYKDGMSASGELIAAVFGFAFDDKEVCKKFAQVLQSEPTVTSGVHHYCKPLQGR